MAEKLTILYGSQTGTAQDIAERLWREAKCYGFSSPVLPMDEYVISNLICESIVVFVCSTAGQGDQPDNMKKFWRFLLRKHLPNNSLQNVRFAVLGLGDSSYIKFNFCAKKLYRRLLQLGAKSIVEPGYADEQHDLGIDAVTDPWISNFWEALKQLLPNTHGILSVGKQKLFPAKWNLEEAGEEKLDENRFTNYDVLEENSAWVTCFYNQRITCVDHFQETRLIKFTLQSLHYKPGDVLMVKPRNSTEAVDQFFSIFIDRKHEIHENLVISIKESDPDMPVPYLLQKPVTLKWLAENYWDLNIVPRRYTFQLLAQFAENELEREKLIEFATPEGQEELFTYCNRPKRTILEVLADFPHATAKLPLEYFFEVLQPIRARAFSIASSPMSHPGELHIIVAVVKYKTNLKKPRIGLCSNWLASLGVDNEVPITLRSGSFRFPLGKKIPVIMVGPGTGIAPFRSFVHEESKNYDSPRHYVFFGCRSKRADFYFREEWKKLEDENKIKFFTAFSRDQSEKIYVQHTIENNEKIIGELLGNQNAYIFVAGNSKNMPNAVRKALISSLSKFKSITLAETEKIFDKMDLEGHYQTETWS